MTQKKTFSVVRQLCVIQALLIIGASAAHAGKLIIEPRTKLVADSDGNLVPQSTYSDGVLKTSTGWTFMKGATLVASVRNSCVSTTSAGALTREYIRKLPRIRTVKIQAYRFRLNVAMTLAQLESRASADPCILRIMRNASFKKRAVDDPRFSLQKYHAAIDTEKGHAAFYDSLASIKVPVTVAVIDSGADLNHSDLKARLWTNSDGHHGYDFSYNDNIPQDTRGHGTHVAGLIGATRNNSIGGTGAAGGHVKLMILRVVNDYGEAGLAEVLSALDYAVENGASIVNISLGSPDQIDEIRAKIAEKVVPRGVTVFAAAGNRAMELTDYSWESPASYAKDIKGMMAIGSVDSSTLRRSDFSNYSNTYVELAAPGSIGSIGIDSTWIGNSYRDEKGTSMASPLAAGGAALAIGLLKTRKVSVTPALIEQIMTKGSATETHLMGEVKGGKVLNLNTLAQYVNTTYPVASTPRYPVKRFDLLRVYRSYVGRILRSFTDVLQINKASDIDSYSIGLTVTAAYTVNPKSVKFQLKSKSTGSILFTRVDNTAPFSLAGDVYSEWQRYTPYPFTAGEYVLAITPYSAINAGGEADPTKSAALKVTNN